jgi:hypothetical protein
MDTFFIYYFIIVGIFFVLSLIHEGIKLMMRDRNDWQFELAYDVLKWCLMLYPIRKRKPSLRLVDGKSNLAGEYDYYSNTITIYRDNNVIPEDLTKTLVHEYFHFYNLTSESKNKLYHDQLEQFGYVNHPQEILCNAMGETLAKLYLQKN